MSGHSKWHKIRRAKEAADAKKGQQFGKFSQEIQSLARQGGADPDANAALRDAINRAKKAGMPQANITRLLDSKTDTNTERITYEAFGPGGSGLLITAETDNSNRTVTAIRTCLKKNGGRLGSPGSLLWKFNENNQPQYPITLPERNKITLENLITELQTINDILHIVTDVTNIPQSNKALSAELADNEAIS